MSLQGDLEHLTARLCQLSRERYAMPVATEDWPASLDEGQWFFSPEMISLAGTDAFAQLSIRDQRRLSFFELINFFSLNIHGEKSMIAGLAQRLYAQNADRLSAYLHHFIDEENKHSQYFAEFCRRYNETIYPERKIAFHRDYAAGEEDFLFFAKIFIFEQIVDHYNVAMGGDDRLHPLVSSIHRMHHRDESRHLAFGRHLVVALFERWCEVWPPDTLTRVRAYLASYLIETLREYHSFDAYRDAGLCEPMALIVSSFESAASKARRRAVAKKCVSWLQKFGILFEDPLS